MKYQITSDNIEISESMKVMAQEKFSKIEKRLTEKEKEEGLVRIVLNKSGAEEEFRVKVDLSYSGKQYFASERDFLLESALINAVNEIERQRRKDDVSYYEDWNEQREAKRKMTEKVIQEDIVEE